MEIYTLTISFPCDGYEIPWSRTIEIKENFTLRNLHKYIQKIIDFDDDHLYEFYIGKNPRNRAQKLSKSSALNEIYPLTGYKIFYLFDFGDCWLFQIKKSRKKKPENNQTKYPVLIESCGDNPEQYPDYED
jgi:Plasmid pRiA4b ORF-3-like protein